VCGGRLGFVEDRSELWGWKVVLGSRAVVIVEIVIELHR
jgi:hypothetical protein